MNSPLTRSPSTGVVRAAVVLGVATLVLLTYAVPFLGFVGSLCLPFVTHGARLHLWPTASTARSLTWSALGWLGLWLPGLVDFLTPLLYDAGIEVSITWLIIPLCGPDGAGVVLLPALAAAVTALAGLLGTVATRVGWAWVAAAWSAPWVHYLVLSQLPHEFVC